MVQSTRQTKIGRWWVGRGVDERGSKFEQRTERASSFQLHKRTLYRSDGKEKVRCFFDSASFENKLNCPSFACLLSKLPKILLQQSTTRCSFSKQESKKLSLCSVLKLNYKKPGSQIEPVYKMGICTARGSQGHKTSDGLSLLQTLHGRRYCEAGNTSQFKSQLAVGGDKSRGRRLFWKVSVQYINSIQKKILCSSSENQLCPWLVVYHLQISNLTSLLKFTRVQLG